MKVGLKSKVFDGLDIIRGYLQGLFTVSETPFGAPPGDKQLYIKRNVPWRRPPGAKRMSMEEFKRRFPNIAANLEKAQAKVKAVAKADREGVALVQRPDGTLTYMPGVAAELYVQNNPGAAIVTKAGTYEALKAYA